MKSGNRLPSLDSLRGIAIALVMGYHNFHALAVPNGHAEFYPYGDTFSDVALFKYGYLGVELFFLISGFVIVMTVENCATPQAFFVRRIARIWPPLLVCSLATFAIIRIVPTPFSRDAGQHWSNFLPSLTLTPPEIWQRLFPKARFVDFAYWSLVVEFRFYVFAALTFWIFGKKNTGRNLVILVLINILVKTALKLLSPATNDIYFQTFIPSFMPWFAAGAVFYELYMRRVGQPGAALYLLAMLAIISRYSFLDDQVRSPYVISAAAVAFFGIFWLISVRTRVANILHVWPLVWIGECSYSIYLIHFEIGASAISSIPKGFPLILQVAMVLTITFIIIVAGRCLFLTVEQTGKLIATRLVGRYPTEKPKDQFTTEADVGCNLTPR